MATSSIYIFALFLLAVVCCGSAQTNHVTALRRHLDSVVLHNRELGFKKPRRSEPGADAEVKHITGLNSELENRTIAKWYHDLERGLTSSLHQAGSGLHLLGVESNFGDEKFKSMLLEKDSLNGEIDDKRRHIFLVIKSAPHYKTRRDTMRSTWIQELKRVNIEEGYDRFVYRFFCEEPRRSLANAFSKEEEQEGDIIKLPERAHSPYKPRALGEKLIDMLTYTDQHFGSSSHIILLDDDVYVNVTMLNERVQTWPEAKSVAGRLLRGQPVIHFESSANMKYGEVDFPLNVFPSYPSGVFVIFTRDAIVPFARSPLPLRLMTNDDAMIGVVLVAYDMQILDEQGISPWGLNEGECDEHFLAIHMTPPFPVPETWVETIRSIHANTTQCLQICG